MRAQEASEGMAAPATTEEAPGPEAATPQPAETPPVAEPVTEAPIAAPPPAPRGRFGLKITLITVALLLMVLGALTVYLLSPTQATAYADPVDAETRSINAALFAALLVGGIEEPFVDVNAERVYVAYSISNLTANGSSQASDVYQRYVIGAAVDAAPQVQRIAVLQYVDRLPRTLWIADVADFFAYLQGEISAAELDARIQKVPF